MQYSHATVDSILGQKDRALQPIYPEAYYNIIHLIDTLVDNLKLHSTV